VIVAAASGIAAPAPARRLASHHGIDVVLAVLVLASALTIPPGALAGLRPLGRRMLLVLGATTLVLPVLALLLSRFVTNPDLRDGVLAVGVAPAEVASLAVASIAGGEVALAAALLVASTLVSVLVAGPVLSLLAGAEVSPTGVLGTLVVVVALPLVLGLVLRRPLRRWSDASVVAGVVSIVAVVGLVWLVSSQVELAASYVGVAVVFVAFISLSALGGALLARGLAPSMATAVVLDVSMRDFAVASGIAVAAFGPAAAGPLGLYGVLVMAWGAVAARLSRVRV
jgi:predicted Na+-dependent transporter